MSDETASLKTATNSMAEIYENRKAKGLLGMTPETLVAGCIGLLSDLECLVGTKGVESIGIFLELGHVTHVGAAV